MAAWSVCCDKQCAACSVVVANAVWLHGLCAVTSNVLLAQAHPTMIKQLSDIIVVYSVQQISKKFLLMFYKR